MASIAAIMSLAGFERHERQRLGIQSAASIRAKSVSGSAFMRRCRPAPSLLALWRGGTGFCNGCGQLGQACRGRDFFMQLSGHFPRHRSTALRAPSTCSMSAPGSPPGAVRIRKRSGWRGTPFNFLQHTFALARPFGRKKSREQEPVGGQAPTSSQACQDGGGAWQQHAPEYRPRSPARTSFQEAGIADQRACRHH